jgi:hypothetical protein
MRENSSIIIFLAVKKGTEERESIHPELLTEPPLDIYM